MESFKEFTKTTIFKIAASLFMIFVSFIFAAIVAYIQTNYIQTNYITASFLLVWFAIMSVITGFLGIAGLIITIEDKGKSE